MDLNMGGGWVFFCLFGFFLWQKLQIFCIVNLQGDRRFFTNYNREFKIPNRVARKKDKSYPEVEEI